MEWAVEYIPLTDGAMVVYGLFRNFALGTRLWKHSEKFLLSSYSISLRSSARQDTMSRRSRAGKYDKSKVKLRVLVDMDAVLCDFERYFLEAYQKKFPDEPFIPLEDRRTFYVRDEYAKLRADLPDKVREVYNGQGFFLNLPEIEGACSAVNKMAQMEDVDVFICSSPLTDYKFCLQEKFEWIDKHLGPEWLDKIILAKDKTMVNGHILIDDRPNIKGAVLKPSWQHVLFTAPYNRNADLNGRCRIDSWITEEWKDIIEDFKKRIA